VESAYSRLARSNLAVFSTTRIIHSYSTADCIWHCELTFCCGPSCSNYVISATLKISFVIMVMLCQCILMKVHIIQYSQLG